MIQLLAPAALLGLSLLAIPVIVHLFQPRRVRQTPFSSLRWLHLTQQRLSRRIQWHQVLLFLLRAGFITLLVLALAQPQWTGGGGGGVAERFIVIDRSASMRYEEADGRTPLAEARRFAEDLIRHAGAGDRTAVLLAGRSATVLNPLNAGAVTVVPRIRQLQAGWEATDLSSALPIITAMVAERRPGAKVQLFFLTDQQQQSWDAAAVQAFVAESAADAATEVHVIDVGSPSPRNVWIAGARLQRDARRQALVLSVDVAAVGDSFTRSVRVSGVKALGPIEQAVSVSPGGEATVRFTLADEPGVATVQLDPPDALPQDDTVALLTMEIGAPRVLVIRDDSAAPSPHLPTALHALSQTRRRLEVQVKTADAVLPGDVERADAIALVAGRAMGLAVWDAVRQQVEQGAGLVVFAGPGTDAAALNARGMLPAPIAPASEAAPGADAPTSNIHWASPVLAQRLDPQVGDAGLARVQRSFRFAQPLPATAQVAARLDDGSPLAAGWSVGRGRVVAVLTDAGDAWWDLPRRAAFLPFMDALLDELIGVPVRHLVTPGESVTLMVNAGEAGASLVVHDPRGRAVDATVTRVGRRLRVQIPVVTEPGLYRLGDQPVLVVVPAGPESRINRPDGAALAAMWQPIPLQVIQAPAERQALLAQQSRLSISPALLVLACLLLLAEMYLVHKLCPRIQPVVVTPLVRRGRGYKSSGVHRAEAV